jgi:hypothetical protein
VVTTDCPHHRLFRHHDNPVQARRRRHLVRAPRPLPRPAPPPALPGPVARRTNHRLHRRRQENPPQGQRLHLPRLSILEAGFGLRLQVSHVAAQTCMPEGLHGRAVGPSVPGEAAPGPLESLASASAEAYPAWVWPAHPVGGFAGSMPPRDRVHQQGGAIPLGGVAGAAVRATFSASARTIADAAQVLPGRTGGPGCHGG